MSANPDAAMPNEAADHQPASSTLAQRKPRLAVFIATACGLGYLPVAPGTWGSLAGLVITLLPWWVVVALGMASQDEHLINASFMGGKPFDPLPRCHIFLAAIIAAIGVWSATRASAFWSQKDPPRVVIDEVSGQHLALFLGCAVPIWWKVQPPWINPRFGFITVN